MNTYLVIFLFLFSLLELSCKSRSGNLESVNPKDPKPKDPIPTSENPIPTKSTLIAAMQNFELGQNVIQEMVPKLQNSETFNNYTPYPFVKINTKHNAANQAFSPENFKEGGNLLEDIKRDAEYFAQVGQDKSGKNLSMLKEYRKPFLFNYDDPRNGQLLFGKLFIPETSIKSEEFFDFFMGILDQENRRPNDKIEKSNLDHFKLWKVGVIRASEGPYPREGEKVTGIGGFDLILKDKDNKTTFTFKHDKPPRFLYLAKDTFDKNLQWFENKKIPTLNTREIGIYIPYLGQNTFSYNKLQVFEAKDLSDWIKIASKELFSPINNLPDEIKIYSKQTVLLANEDKGNPVYYLDSDGKLKPLTKAALATF
jgi:hypothetical protein